MNEQEEIKQLQNELNQLMGELRSQHQRIMQLQERLVQLGGSEFVAQSTQRTQRKSWSLEISLG